MVSGAAGPSVVAVFVAAQLGLIGVSSVAHTPSASSPPAAPEAAEPVAADVPCPQFGWSSEALLRALCTGLLLGVSLTCYCCVRASHFCSGVLGLAVGAGLAAGASSSDSLDVVPYVRASGHGVEAGRARLAADEDW